MTKIEFTGKSVGLIVRGKKSPSHEPGVMEQHADCVLVDGSPIGFFGEGGANTGAQLGSASWNQSGMNMKGTVYDYSLLKIHRPYYIDVGLAKKYDVVSTLLVIETSPPYTTLFTDYWRRLKANPKGFQLVGGNCSTRSSGHSSHPRFY